MKVPFDELIRKYNVAVPRYTSYPTVPFWAQHSFSIDQWKHMVKKTFQETNLAKGISLYIHLPFCESLCTYCACNTRITKNHQVEERYSQAVLQEWMTYKRLWESVPALRELHLGGGTPTFFSPANLEKLLTPILAETVIHKDHAFSFEGHPNNTTRDHLITLARLGFSRVSYGVQDLDERVQKAINRIQPLENLQRVVRESRDVGYSSISFDLVYGLPFQTAESVRNTVEKVIALRPDRIAFYSYAHVPWMKPGQRGYEDCHLPGDVEKRALYETGRSLFLEAGYIDVGMDHFALPADELAIALEENRLHRNFMGYTVTKTDLLIGLGASAISDAHYAYAQNEKNVESYERRVMAGDLAVVKGHVHSLQDRFLKHVILDLACRGKLSAAQLTLTHELDDTLSASLDEMQQEGLIRIENNDLYVTSMGRTFIRNICQLFDHRMKAGASKEKLKFSQAI